jgi:hypothetical protein
LQFCFSAALIGFQRVLPLFKTEKKAETEVSTLKNLLRRRQNFSIKKSRFFSIGSLYLRILFCQIILTGSIRYIKSSGESVGTTTQGEEEFVNLITIYSDCTNFKSSA